MFKGQTSRAMKIWKRNRKLIDFKLEDKGRFFWGHYTFTNQKEDSWNCVNLSGWKPAGAQEEMNYHSSHDSRHEASANKKCISVFQSCSRWELEYEVIVDPCAFPQEEVAPIHEQVQA